MKTMLIDNREYSEPELKSYIKGLLKRIADAENLNDELKKEKAELYEANEELAESHTELKEILNDEIVRYSNSDMFTVVPLSIAVELREENEQLKKYLKIAIELVGHYAADFCFKYQTELCNCDCDEDCIFKHMEKIKDLIGGDANGSDE